MSQEQVTLVSDVTDEHIKGFFGEFRYLSNYDEQTPIVFEGETYKSTEAAYQAAKTLDLEDRKRFQNYGPGKSKREGAIVALRADFDTSKEVTMLEILRYKFTHNEDLKTKLLSTGDKYLEETNWWNDVYWGVCKGVGKNRLGHLLMQVRSELKA